MELFFSICWARWRWRLADLAPRERRSAASPRLRASPPKPAADMPLRARRCSTAPWARGASANRRKSCAAAASRRRGWPSPRAPRDGRVVGTVRLWDVAVAFALRAAARAARRRPVAEERRHRLGADAPRHRRGCAGSATGAILLVGDAPYYGRFGFSAEKTGSLAMPGPYERHRLLALELRSRRA